MGESYFWKPFAQGVATPIVLIGGTNLLLKDFKVSNPYLYWGGLAASSAIVVGILADKIKVPILNAEGDSWDGTTGDDFRKYDDTELSEKDHEIILDEIEMGFENYPADTLRNAKASAISQINWFGIDNAHGEYDAETFGAEDDGWVKSTASERISGYPSFLRKKQFHFEKEFTMPPYPNTLKIDVDGYFTGISYEDADESYFNTPEFIDERKEFLERYTDPKLQEILEKYTMSNVKTFYEEIADDWLFGEREEEEIEEEDMSDWGLTDEEIAKYKQEMAEEKAEEKAQEMADLEEEINSHIEYCDDYFKKQMNRYMSDWSNSWMGEYNIDLMTIIHPTFLPTHIKFVDETRGITLYEYNDKGKSIESYDAESFGKRDSQNMRELRKILERELPILVQQINKIEKQLKVLENGTPIEYPIENIRDNLDNMTEVIGEIHLQKIDYLSHYEAETFESPKSKTHPYVIDGKRRLKTWKENAREIKKEYDDEDWRDADKQIDYLKGIHEYLEDCTDEEFEDWFINIDQPDMSQFAFDYENVFGRIYGRDREERMNYFEGYINMLREGQQNRFPESFYDAETFNSDSHTDSFMADMPVNAVKNNDGWYIPSVHRNDYKEIFKNWKPSKYPYEKKITQDSVNEACNSCGEEKVHYQFYLARKNSVNPKMRFIDNATYCQYDTNTCGGNICGDCAENASCENCGAEICTYCEEENNYDHSDLVCVDCREFNESLEDD